MDEEKARKQREAEEAEREKDRAAKAAQELDEQVQADHAMRQLIAREQQHKANRKRTNSEATAVPMLSDTPVETFSQEVEVGEVFFNTVKLFHPRTGECVFLSFFAVKLIMFEKMALGWCIWPIRWWMTWALRSLWSCTS